MMRLPLAVAAFLTACSATPTEAAGDGESAEMAPDVGAAQPSPAAEPTLPARPPEPKPEPKPSEVAPTRAGPQIRLEVSATLRADLIPVERTRYESDALDGLFASLRQAARPLCGQRHLDEPRDRDAVKAYVVPWQRYLATQGGTRLDIMAGCWNFVHMNDRSPHRDMDLVHALYGHEGNIDCWSVGVVQPYLMHDRLGCRSLTMLDFDWAVHALHWQLAKAAAHGGLAEETLDDTLEGLEVGWIAHREPKPRHAMSMSMLCYDSEAEHCRAGFSAVQSSWTELESVTYALAGLHEAPFEPISAESLRVVYLSNAVERIYTRRSEFKAFIRRLGESMAEGDLAVLVHHAGGRRGFGIYEARKRADGVRLTTRCRDAYESTAVGAESDTYETWFEGAVRDRGSVPTCSALRRRHRTRRGG